MQHLTFWQKCLAFMIIVLAIGIVLYCTALIILLSSGIISDRSVGGF